MSVYVAGSSAEIDRARRVMHRYRAAGVEVTSTWPDMIAAAGDANPRDATRYQRGEYATTVLAQVAASHVLHFLVPEGAPSFGAGVEYGFALAHRRLLVASGDTLRTIFTAKGREHPSDDEAIAQIIAAHERAGKILPGTPIDTWGKVIVRSPDARPVERIGRPLAIDSPVHVPVTIDGFTIEPTGQEGIHTGRPRYRVTCKRCGGVEHEATTGPEFVARHHRCDEVEPAPAPVEPERSTAMRVASDEEK